MNTIESISPILSVADMQRSLGFYVDLLGFENAEWCNDTFTGVSRDGCSILLRQDDDPAPSRIYISLENARAVHDELKPKGVTIVMGPTDKGHALEITIEDPDGNLIRIGSEPEK
ncbi:MAG: hypothetical protein CME19_14515 [Gemmatimonadetes bacterium]|nr:hypothetical protein [Gemmatimonadota bacterium]|tara:strand:- start:584 stop:928 length:345 start_codon:yes stop_codon:yes gene_type:complete